MSRPTDDGPSCLAIDIGTTSTRVAVSGLRGAKRVLRHQNADPTSLTLDIDALWDVITRLVISLPKRIRAAVDVIAVTAHVGTVLLDHRGRPLGPALGWGNSQGVARLGEIIGPDLERYGSVTGRPVPTGGALAALVGLRRDHPDEFSRIRYVIAPKDYVVLRLTGVIATDPVSAAYTGAADIRTRTWFYSLLEDAGIRGELFPPVHPATSVATVSPSVASKLGLRRDLPVIIGGPDGTVGATFLLEGRPARIADIAGTTDVLVRKVAEPPGGLPPTVVNPWLVETAWSIGGPTGLTGGGYARWLQRLGYSSGIRGSKAGVEAKVAEIAPGSDGLDIGVSETGERFPRWDPNKRGWVRGIAEHHGPAHFLRAALEGAAYTVREGLDVVDPSRRLPVVMSGGASRSAVTAQLRADVFGRPLLLSTEAETTLRGAVFLGLLALGERAEAMQDEEARLEPDPERARSYDQLYARWRQH